MITFLLGLPGSGKSYYAVDRIYNNFSSNKDALRDKKVTFKNCYTNINEFNFEKVDNVYKLDFDNLHKILSRLHQRYKEKKTDEYIVRFLKKVKLKDTLFVIDEAHNFLDREDKVLIWWLSYHRHLFHEIILITQSLALIHTKYKKFSEFFYKARSSSLTLDKRYFYYTIFCESRLTMNSKSGVKKIKRRKNVFDLYKSGDSINSQNVLLKFLLIFSVLLVLMLLIFYFAFSQTKSEDKKETKEKTIDVSKLQYTPEKKVAAPSMQNPINSIDYESSIFLTLHCNKTYCFNNQFSISEDVFNHFIKNKEILIIKQKYKSLKSYLNFRT